MPKRNANAIENTFAHIPYRLPQSGRQITLPIYLLYSQIIPLLTNTVQQSFRITFCNTGTDLSSNIPQKIASPDIGIAAPVDALKVEMQHYKRPLGVRL